MQTKYTYSMNAIMYCLWLYEIKSTQAINKFSDRLFSFFAKYIVTEKYRKRYYSNRKETEILLDRFLNNNKRGLNISLAGNTLGFIYSDYPCFISFITLGLLLRLYGDVTPGILILLFALPIGLAYIPAYNAVFRKDKYLVYFKKFEKEDEKWHKKWKLRTIVFCVGGIVALILGIVGAFTIALYNRI